jgi:hypothetical protein
MFGKGAMSRHEKYCKDNPINKHKCFDFCKHLSMKDNRVYLEYGTSGSIEFTCDVSGERMYSYKFEKNYNKPATALNGLTRMPLKCEMHEYMKVCG